MFGSARCYYFDSSGARGTSEEKHKHADTVKVIHEKQQKIISLLELQAQDLLREVEETTNTYQARKTYEQNKGIR